MVIGAVALQPASAVQDSNNSADVVLTPDPPTCDDLACTWNLAPATDAYSFVLMRDSMLRGGKLVFEAQSAPDADGHVTTVSARLIDPYRIVIIDFFDGRARVWTGGALAMQATTVSGEPTTPNTTYLREVSVTDVPFDASATGAAVRVRQINVPAPTFRTLAPPTDAEVTTFGGDLSAIARVTLSEPVTGFEPTDFALSPDSVGCRISDLIDAGDHISFQLLIRGCSGMYAGVRLLAWSVMGRVAGPESDNYFGPVPCRVVVAAAPAPAPTPTASASPSVSATATPTVTPEPVATQVAAPVLVELAPVPADPVASESAASEEVPKSVIAPVKAATKERLEPTAPTPEPDPEPSQTAAPASHNADSSGPIVGGPTDSSADGGLGTAESTAWRQQWLAAASIGVAAALAGVGATIAARKMRVRGRVKPRFS
jgi:hypothetical protein